MSLEHLISRDVEDIYVPSTIYGIGGGGKEAVLQLFEQDWFAIEVMRNQSGTTNVYLVDTTENEGGINERIQARQAELNQIRDRMRETLEGQRIGGINFEAVEVTRNIRTDRASALTGEGSVPDIITTTNIDEWWLERQDLIEPGTSDLYDFSKGACRCRAIGKAFHYKALAEAEDQGYNLNYALPGDDDKVAIFTGLGGGTGSGIFMDVARELYEQNEARRTTLFATMPTRKEQVKERANAFAALSELEYQAFSEEDDIFDNIILFPLQPLDPDIAVKDQELLELDRAMAYVVIGYYNAGQYDDAVNQSPSYAPFTIALPQVFRYDIEGIIEAKENAIETINRKIESLNAEHQIYGRVADYVEEHYDTAGTAELKRNDEDLLRRRIQFMRELVELPLFEELEFETAVETGQKLLNTVYDADESEGETYADSSLDVAFAENDLEDLFLRELGFHFEFEYQDIDVGSELNEIEELDSESIQRVILAESARLKDKYETLESVRQIPTSDTGDESTAKLLNFMLDPTARTDESARVKAVQKHRDQTETELSEARARHSEVSERIDRELSVQENLVESKVESWENAVSGDLRAMAELEALDIDDDLDALMNELRTFAMESQQGRTPPSSEGIEQKLDALRETLEPIDHIDFGTEYDHILQQVELAQQLREDWNTYLEARDRGLTQKLNPLSDTPDERSAKKVLKSTIVNMSERVFTTSHLGPNQTEFELDVAYDPRADGEILDEIRTTSETLQQGIVSEFEQRLKQIAEQEGDGTYQSRDVEAFRERLESITDPDDLQRERADLVAYVSETYKTTASEDLPDLESRQAELEAEVDALAATKRKYDDVLTLYKDLREVHERFTDKHEAFNEDINRQAERFGAQAFAEYQPNQHYIHKYVPQDTRRAIEKQSIAETDLFQRDWEQNERSRIQDFTSEVVRRRASSPDYVGLRERDFGNQDYDFTGTRIHVAKISEGLDTSGNDKAKLWIDDLEVRSKLTQNYYLDESGERMQMFNQWATENGGPWDIALTFFIQGLGFLDNLRDVVETRGYKDGYETRQREIHNIALHHSYGLERGFYVRRRRFIDPRKSNEQDLYFDTDANRIRSELTSCLEVVPTTDGTDVERGSPEPITYQETPQGDEHAGDQQPVAQTELVEDGQSDVDRATSEAMEQASERTTGASQDGQGADSGHDTEPRPESADRDTEIEPTED